MSMVINHIDAQVTIKDLHDGRRLVSVNPLKEDFFVPFSSWETAYPIELIKLILQVKGPAYLCDEIMRDESPTYVEQDVTRDLYAYFDQGDFTNKRVLDFGCGSGASSVILGRHFPTADIVGIELCSDLLSVAKQRIEYYGLLNVKLKQSPNETSLPSDIGRFDFVIMSAVYEHLLPEERTVLMPKIYKVIREGGYLFINQTPNRMCPIEGHTTGLPLLNYLPNRLVLEAAHRFSNRVEREDSWVELLRKGIRGATEREIIRKLGKNYENPPVLMEPDKGGFHDRIDLWFSALDKHRMRVVKRMVKATMKATWKLLGITFMPNLTIVIKKSRRIT